MALKIEITTIARVASALDGDVALIVHDGDANLAPIGGSYTTFTCDDDDTQHRLKLVKVDGEYLIQTVPIS